MEDDHQLTPVSTSTTKKKYVTRLQSACKKRKSKCDGREPCRRCLSSEIDCTYVSSYNRVQRLNPQRRGRITAGKARTSSRTAAKSSNASNSSQRTEEENQDPHTENSQSIPPNPARLASEGDASAHGFLRRVSDHLAKVGQGLPRSLFSREQDFLDSNDPSIFTLPPKTITQGYVDCFFDHASVTYRYVSRSELVDTFEKVYADDQSVTRDHDRMAVLFSVMAIGCLCMSSWKNEPLPPWRQKSYKFLQAAEARLAKTQGQFPPSVRHIQAVMLKCQFEVGSGRFNSAWMSLGCAVRLSQMIDIHREQKLCDPIEGHFRRCLFWAMFMIDRYLAAILGRPMAIHDSDVNMSYPYPLNHTVECYLSTTEKRLTKILGLAISRLYLGAVHTPESQEQIVTKLEQEIDDWLRDTPDFFHPRKEKERGGDQEFYEVSWVLRRQQRTTQAAFLFSKMMIYRGYLLREFLDQTPSTPSSSSCSGRIRACVDNALAMVSLATNVGADECKYNAAFWTTSHFLFCATSILLVYCILYPDSDDTNKVHAAIEDAMKVHRELDYGAHINDQKLLEESCSRVHINPTIYRLDSHTQEPLESNKASN
ncbi:Activator of stress genes 1 [Colletotrichum siamense]|nr:Activator of stress genes 1 [Colletotrichum siamense]